MERDLKKDRLVNRFKLDEECENHSNIYGYYSDLQSDLRIEKDEDEAKLKLLEGERELDIRANPPDDVPKITEAVIKALLATDKILEEQRKKVREIKAQLHTLDSAIRTLEHKKSMLGKLVDLYGQNYFSMPKGGNNKTSNDEAQISARKKLSKKGTE